EEVFFYSSGRSSNEAAFLMQLAARAYGTANIHNCSFYCHSASSVALAQVYGSGTASITLEDLAQADLVLVAGANPASNHPRLVSQLVKLRRGGGKVVMVNPLRELGLVRFRVPSDWRSMLFGSTVSDLYLQPHVGADLALFKALLKGVVEAGALDRAFVAEHTSGWEAVAADLAAASWDELVGRSGVARPEIERAVTMLAEARRGVFCWAMGLTHHAHGVDNVLALANLALARGWLGRPGCGLLPIRGHSNVQGVGSCGMTPVLREAFAAKLEELYGIKVVSGVGQDTYSSMLAAAEGRIQACVLLGGNLFASNPDRAWTAAALRKIPTSISITTKLNEGHVHGRGRTAVILPVLARDEETQATTQESMFNFVRLSEGGMPAVAGELRLRAVRSEGQFNTVVYEEEDLYRGNRRRDVVMMAAADAARLGVGEGERVLVETDAGRLEAAVAVVDICPGNLAMYYPEANALVPRRLDGRSKTPAFKSVAARVTRAVASAALAS